MNSENAFWNGMWNVQKFRNNSKRGFQKVFGTCSSVLQDANSCFHVAVSPCGERVSAWRYVLVRIFCGSEESSQNKGDNQSNKSSEPAKGIPQKGLETIETDGQLKERAGGKDQIKAQALPLFDPFHPESDLLYGYDVMGFSENNRGNSNKIKYSKFERPQNPTREQGSKIKVLTDSLARRNDPNVRNEEWKNPGTSFDIR